MRGVAQRIRSASPRTVLAVGWAVMVVLAFPGQMSPDCVEHLVEGRTGFYTDGHPPVLNLLFWFADLIIAGPLLILMLETTCFVVGLYLILRRAMSDRAAAWVTAALFVFPPIATTMLVVWKDSLMPGFLVLGMGCLLDPRRRVKLAGLLVLAAASAVRYNAFAATGPLVFFLFEWRPGLFWLRRYAIAFAAWLAITFGAFTLNSVLVDREMYYWSSSLAPHDIVGTLAYTDNTIPDAELEELLAGTGLRVHHDIHAKMRIHYSPKSSFQLVSQFVPDALWHLPVYGIEPAPESQRDAIGRAWWKVITTYPGGYIEHRLRVMKEVLSFSRHRPIRTAYPRKYEFPGVPVRVGLTDKASSLQHAATDSAVWLARHTPLFESWMYLAIALLLLGFTRGHRDIFALLASGIVIELSLLVLAPAPDFRYSHWMVTSTIIATVMLIARRASGVEREGVGGEV